MYLLSFKRDSKVTIFTLLIFFSCLALSSSPKHPQAKIKAAYIFNFIKYVRWPNESSINTLYVGYYGKDNSYYNALLKMEGKSLRGFKLKLKNISSLDNFNQLHAIVIDKNKSFTLTDISKRLKGKPILIISDMANAKKNTMLNFVLTKNNNLTFELNRYNMINAKLKILADIVVLGGSELDIAGVLKEMDNTLLRTLSDLESKSNQLDVLSSEIKLRETQLSELQQDLLSQGRVLTKKKIKITSQTKQLQAQYTELKANNLKFTNLSVHYGQMEKELSENKKKLVENINTLSQLKKEINDKELSISSLAEKIFERKSTLVALQKKQRHQEKAMAVQSNVIKTQYEVILLTIAGLSVVLIMVVVIYRNNREKHRINLQLEENILILAETNEQLANTQKQLVESEKMAALGGLVAGVAHEINTPLGISITAISNLTDQIDVLSEKFESGQLTRQSLKKLLDNEKLSSEMVLRNLTRASELILHFKQVAVDQSHEEQREFELVSYLEEVVFSIKPQLKEANHQVFIHADIPIPINSYPGVFAQIMTNLIMNSILHGFKAKQNGQITIELILKESVVYISYRDSGIGLNTLQLEKVFEPFYTTARSLGGTGLGMSITYNLVVSKLRGKINCIKSDSGAHFQLSFPVKL